MGGGATPNSGGSGPEIRLSSSELRAAASAQRIVSIQLREASNALDDPAIRFGSLGPSLGSYIFPLFLNYQGIQESQTADLRTQADCASQTGEALVRLEKEFAELEAQHERDFAEQVFGEGHQNR